MGFPHNDVVTAVVPRHSDLKSKTPFGNYMAEIKPFFVLSFVRNMCDSIIQVNLFQKQLFLHQLTQNMTGIENHF